MKYLSLLIVIGLTAALSACASGKKDLQPVAIAAPPPTPGLTQSARVQLAIANLQDGDVLHAKSELNQLLLEAPNSTIGRTLLSQIDTPITTYFPAESFGISLRSGESLSSMADYYLGNKLLFYALARYNNIEVPKNVKAGQAIRIPKTPGAMAAASRPAPAPAPAAAAVAAPRKPDDTATKAMMPAPVQEESGRSAEQNSMTR